jgi:negative regulator of flagellin synthesis FlgM
VPYKDHTEKILGDKRHNGEGRCAVLIVSNVSRVYGSYQPQSAQKLRPTRAKEKVDMVTVSSHAKDYQTVRAAIAGLGETSGRASRIEDLKARYEAGTYKVSAEDVAEKIMTV